jgi:ATP-binding cassette subfamily B protein RaxB
MDGLFREEVVAQRKDSTLGQVTVPTGRWFAADSWVPFFGRPRVPVLLQSETGECGLACIAMVAAYHGEHSDVASLRRRFSTSARGLTLAQLISIGQRLSLSPRALRLELADLSQIRCPAILHWDLNHYVVLERMHGQRAVIVDPSCGRRTVSAGTLSVSFTGVALELEPSPSFKRRREKTPLSLMSFLGESPGLVGAMARLLVLSLLLQGTVLVGPLFGQVVIDRVIAESNPDLLTIVSVAFLALAVVQVGVSAVRGWMVVVLGANLRLI